MKKIIAVALAAFALNASAFSLTGNDNIADARAYLRIENNGPEPGVGQVQWGLWLGRVSGISSVFDEWTYRLSVCYPEGVNAGQLAEIAANYLIENPEERQASLNFLVWKAHKEAYGLKLDETCYQHETWLQFEDVFKE